MSYCEINFDGLVGPTHNFAGLAFGNLASTRNRSAISNPRAAALEGLQKMQRLMTLGCVQAVLPPLMRPDFVTLKRLGFLGVPQQMLDKAWQQAPDLFTACCSASSMWTANAATIAPSCDTQNAKLNLTPANLLSNFHRTIEAPQTTLLLRKIFSQRDYFEVHEPVPAFAGLADEGAANHMRLGALGQPGLHVFVYGGADHLNPATKRFPPRQLLSACQAVARLNHLPAERTLFIQQHPDAIDAGAFHNDVVAVSHHHVLFCHEQAFVDQPRVLDDIRRKMDDQPFHVVEVKAADIPLDVAISTYLFNAQIVTTAQGEQCLVVPVECEENAQVKQYLQQEVLSHPAFDRLEFVDVRQSMRNGGGPACLRLRIAMNEEEIQQLDDKALLTPERISLLREVISTGYPDQLQLQDLRDWSLCQRLNQTVLKLYEILGIPCSQGLQ